jgi:hypothetical protein
LHAHDIHFSVESLSSVLVGRGLIIEMKFDPVIPFDMPAAVPNFITISEIKRVGVEHDC